MSSGPIIAFELRPSPALWRLCGLAALAAGTAPWLSGLPWVGCLAADIMTGLVLWRECRRRRRHRPRPCVWLGDQRWLLDAGTVRETTWTLRHHWRWGPWVVVELAAPGRRCGLWLGPGNLPAGMLRRLRARLALQTRRPEVERHPLS